jgi:LuxR family maltose regulon positive regulatory protein
MPIPILTTKLYLPPLRPKITPRPRLIEQLNAGLHRKLTLISAQAGFGKSTLVSQWLAVCGRPAGWLSLDERDSELTRFLAYVVAALQTISAEIAPQTVTLLATPQPPATDDVLTTLINEIARFAEPFILVLDDYHIITAPEIDNALTFLLEHMPPQMHLVIATREDPQLPLARLRVRGQMTELRVADLRFSANEAAGFLQQEMGLTLSAENIAALENRTEGWIAGLQLAALALQTKNQSQTVADRNSFIETFTGGHHFILDYLVEEVLANQPDDVRDFLLQTAILNRLSSGLCDAVTGKSGSKTLLNQLLQSNLFLIPLDNTRSWYRYHHLFAEVLHTHLLEEQPDRVQLLHRRASDWHAQHGDEAEAIDHAFAAQDFERAANLLELTWRTMDRTLQSPEWLRWAEMLPDEIVYVRPVLSAGYAWALLDSGHFEAAEQRLQDAERAVESVEIIVNDQVEFDLLTFSITSARAYIAQALGDIPNTLNYGQQALDLLPQDSHTQRAIPLALLSLAHWSSGNLDSAYQTLSDSMDAFLESGTVMLAISGTFAMAEMRITQGRLHDAIRVYREALQLVNDSDDPTVRGKANLHLGLSELYREQGNVEATDQHWQAIPPLQDLDRAFQQRWAIARARAEQRRGNFAAAHALFDEAIKRFEQIYIADVRPAAAMKARSFIMQGNLVAAADWAQAHDVAVDEPLSFLREYEHATLARLRMAEGALDGALGLLERLAVAAENGNRIGSLIEIQLLQALAHHAQGNQSEALAVLSQALISAEPQGYLQLFVDEGQPVAELLDALRQKADTHFDTNVPQMQAYIQKLLAAFSPHQPTPSEPETTLIDPLSERELDVLRLLTTELSGPQIANELTVSLNTFRTHTKNIYSKLGVNNRRAAVRRAAELALL